MIVPRATVRYDLEKGPPWSRDYAAFSSGGGVDRAFHPAWNARLNPAEAGATVIDFLCPNGHRIRCPADQAGQVAKCPRCGVKFRVPSAEETETDESNQTGSDVSSAELVSGAPGGSSDSQPRVPPREPQIEFLCPNGHHLHGPASLQGRPGACPECGSRFRIPVVDEAQEGSGSGQITPHVPAAGETGSKTAKLAQAAPSGTAGPPSSGAGQTPFQAAHAAAAGHAAPSSKIVLQGPPSCARRPPQAIRWPNSWPSFGRPKARKARSSCASRAAIRSRPTPMSRDSPAARTAFSAPRRPKATGR